MKILLTNDDGLDAPGIEALYTRLAVRHEVTVVAPDRDRSGASHSITVGKGITARPVGPRRWAIDGTPADCVRLGIVVFGVEKPDIVIAGVNQGANLGTDILLSGTVGAARQAALMGVPAIAVSCLRYSDPSDPDFAATFVSRNLDALRAVLGRGLFININAPTSCGPLAIARPGNIPYEMLYDRTEIGDGSIHVKLSARPLPLTEDDAEDCRLAVRNAVVLSAFGLWGPDEALESRLRQLLPSLVA